MEVRWRKSTCDWNLYYLTTPGNWQYFGLVCTKNNSYVWNWGQSRNFGKSTKDAKKKLLAACVNELLQYLVKARISF